MKQLSMFFALALLGLLALVYWLNRVAADLALAEIFGALGVGIKILFFTGLVLVVAWCVIELKRRSRVTVIGHGKYGQAQAIIHKGEVVHLATAAQAQLDPQQQLNMLRTVMQMQSQIQKMAAASVQQLPDPQLLALPEPEEHIGAIVRYEDVCEEVPAGMSLLGIHPSNGNLELTNWEKLKMLWIIGSSSTGKSNTAYGKALEARNHGAKIAVIDQHVNKPDSLAKKLAPLSDAFIRPVATDEAMSIATLRWFKDEFDMRVADKTGQRALQKMVLIIDEMNRMARSENAEQVRLLKEVVAIGGEESRGFGMYVWCLSQKAAHLKWLRDSAITVIVHRVTRMEEAKLACNDDLAAARRLLKFPVGRSYIYGVDFEDLIELQQPLYDSPVVVESDVVGPSVHLPHDEATQQQEANREAPGSHSNDDSGIADLSTIKMLREIGKRLKKGDDRADIVKSFGLPYGRATQEIGAVVDMVAEQIEAEG